MYPLAVKDLIKGNFSLIAAKILIQYKSNGTTLKPPGILNVSHSALTFTIQNGQKNPAQKLSSKLQGRNSRQGGGFVPLIKLNLQRESISSL